MAMDVTINGETINNLQVLGYFLLWAVPWFYGWWVIAEKIAYKGFQPFMEWVLRRYFKYRKI